MNGVFGIENVLLQPTDEAAILGAAVAMALYLVWCAVANCAESLTLSNGAG